MSSSIAEDWLASREIAQALQDATVHRCCIDDAATLECRGRGAPVRIRIEGDFTLFRSGERWHLNPDGRPRDLGPLLSVLFSSITSVSILDRTLHIDFGDGSIIDVPPDPVQHAWELRVGDRLLVSLPDGNIEALGSTT